MSNQWLYLGYVLYKVDTAMLQEKKYRIIDYKAMTKSTDQKDNIKGSMESKVFGI